MSRIYKYKITQNIGTFVSNPDGDVWKEKIKEAFDNHKWGKIPASPWMGRIGLSMTFKVPNDSWFTSDIHLEEDIVITALKEIGFFKDNSQIVDKRTVKSHVDAFSDYGIGVFIGIEELSELEPRPMYPESESQNDCG